MRGEINGALTRLLTEYELRIQVNRLEISPPNNGIAETVSELNSFTGYNKVLKGAIRHGTSPDVRGAHRPFLSVFEVRKWEPLTDPRSPTAIGYRGVADSMFHWREGRQGTCDDDTSNPPNVEIITFLDAAVLSDPFGEIDFEWGVCY